MKKKFVNVLLVAALLSAAGASVVSCKDNDADIRTELKGEFNEQFVDLRKQLASQKAELEAKIEALQSQLNQCKTDCDGKIAGLDERIKTLETFIATNRSNIEAINKLIERINAIEQKGYVTRDDVLAMLPEIPDLSEYAKQEWVEKKLQGLGKSIEDLISGAGYITADDLKNELDKRGYLTQDDLDDYLKINDLDIKVKDLLDRWEYITDEDLQKELTTLRGEIGQLLQEEIIQVNDKLDNVQKILQNILRSMITGIEINATSNPIFGSAALPADVRTTVLAAYYGNASTGFMFPETAVINASGIHVDRIGADAGEVLFNKEEGNAGTVYLTINPNTVDFVGQTVDLVTSQDVKSPIELSPLKLSDKELSFGYSRAANNGFYEAAATLNEADIQNVKANIDLDNLKSSVQDLLNQRNKTAIAKLAATLFAESSDVLPAYAVKASWMDDVDDIAKEEHTHSVLSQYAIAATAVKPLSYDFMKDAHYSIPGLDRIESAIGGAIDNVFSQIKTVLPDLSGLNDITIGKIEISEASKEKLKFTQTIEIEVDIDVDVEDIVVEGQTVDVIGEDGTVIGTATTKAVTVTPNIEVGTQTIAKTVEFDMNDAFASIIGDINDSLDLGQLQDALNNLSGLSNLGSDLDSMRDNIKNKLFGYIDQLNSKFSDLIGTINTALQPCLIFIDGKENLGRVTTSKTGTQVVGTSITLAPTSYTAELFAPAYKKFIAVTAIKGRHNKPVASFNKENGFGTILSGEDGKIVKMEGLEKGCIYEITYSALDYSGVIRTNKYYISVK